MTLFMKLRETLEEGRNQGLEEGRSLGELQKLISLVRKKHAKDFTVNDIADILEETPEFIAEIVHLLEKYPDLTDEDLSTKLYR